jgi:hypothetical protein
MPSRDYLADHSTVLLVRRSSGLKSAAGQDAHLSVANDGNGLDLRALIGFAGVQWSGVTALVSAKLILTRTTQSFHCTPGGSSQAICRRITGEWSANNGNMDGGGQSSTSGTVYPGPSTSGGITCNGGSGSGTDTFDVTSLVLAWAPPNVSGPGGTAGKGATQRGLALHEVDGQAHAAEWWSFNSGSKPILRVVTSDNAPPGQPSLLGPLGPAADGRTLRFTCKDPDGDPITAADVQLGVDPGFATPLWAPVGLVPTVSGKELRIPYAGPALATDGTVYWWRVMCRDAPSGYGRWSEPGAFQASSTPITADAYDDWAGAILSAGSVPVVGAHPGTVRPEGEEVAALTSTEYRGRWRIIADKIAPPVLDTTVQIVGLSVSVSALGWELTATSGEV